VKTSALKTSTRFSSFRLGSWVVEPATGFLRRGEEEVRLEPRVASLLCLLASQPGHVFSKAEIFEQVWEQAFVEDSTLSRCVSDLRRALGDDARNPSYIQTLPKKGYRCIAKVVAVEDEPLEDKPRLSRLFSLTTAPVLGLGLGLAFVLVALAGGWLALRSDPTTAPAASAEETVLSAYDYYLEGRDHYKRYRKGDNLEAIALYRKALEVDPSFALAHAELANALAVQKGNFHLPGPWVEQALASARTAVKLQPNLPEAHKALGHALSQDDQLESAADHYRHALELRPGYHEATHNLSLILHILGRHDEAFEGFQRYHDAGKTSADSTQHVGWIYFNVGMDSEAEEWFRRSLELEPYHIGSQRGLALLERRQGEIADAQRRLKALLDVHPSCQICLVEAGELELVAGHPHEAAERFRHALDNAREGFPVVALRLGEALRRIGDDEAGSWLEEARDAARQDLDRSATDPWPAWVAAAVEAQLGHSEEAVDLLREALGTGWSQWDLDDPVFARLRPDPRYQALLRDSRSKLLAMRKKIEATSQP